MHSVIQAAGLNMREELILNISPDRPAHAPTVIVLAGLTRRCESVHVVREALADCVAGRAAMVGVLQHYDTGQFPASGSWMGGGERYEKLPDSFSECASRFSAAARGTACRLVIGRQWFKQTRKHECTRQVPPVGNVDRATIQTLALGRAYEWARAFAPGARLFVRARLDMAFCAPDLRNSPALPRRMLVADSESDSITGGRFVYDLGAIMSADAADDYFGAWRVWAPLNCSNTCYAGRGSSEPDAVKPALSILCSGEVPLSKWLAQQGLAPSLRMRRGKLIGSDAAKNARTVSAMFRQTRAQTCALGFPAALKPPRGARMWACAKPGARGCKSWRTNRCYQMSSAVLRRVVWLPPLAPKKAGPRARRSVHVCRTASSSTVCSLHNVVARSAHLSARSVPWLALARASIGKACAASGGNYSHIAHYLRSVAAGGAPRPQHDDDDGTSGTLTAAGDAEEDKSDGAETQEGDDRDRLRR